jgi:hypothetical protein
MSADPAGFASLHGIEMKPADGKMRRTNYTTLQKFPHFVSGKHDSNWKAANFNN